MKKSEYDRLRRSELSRHHRGAPAVWARLTHDVSVRGGTIAAGTRVQLIDKWSGLAIQTARCEHCGVSLSAAEVPFAWIDLEAR